ncbi:TetR family transcriptional regulator [Herbihabitans rhizosphaerae]|uniref:TetR family transcriptional regulator n=1 Tax=Herbihabitans rhizosphaerae TaxID=1872711 RepID=A0A4Q7KF83_9PSEU|nr:TetR/AcrR family transcriptional regulator [Herbihabitans rhizosphaerae]RZS30321.1 TetR family transcriptional regulator [Herbihabitans rhizosphaerae]
MARERGESKQRMLTSAVALLRERGAAAVTVDAVLAHSGAPRGSVYHHFPGGRHELITSAVRLAGDHVAALLDEAVREGDPVRVLRGFVRFWKRTLVETDYLSGCPVVALAVDGGQAPPETVELVRDIFTRWQTSLTALLTGAGAPPRRARRLATLVVASVEGAIILSRAQRDAGPLDDVLAELTPLLAVTDGGGRENT